MTRATVVLTILLSTYGLQAQRTLAAESPNIVLIVTDDQRWDTLGDAHSLSGPAMPIVQAELVNPGMTFTNAFVSNPLCAPSRASILTSQFAHNHGVRGNLPPQGGVLAFDDSSTLATWLPAGYRTGLIGKYMNGYLSSDIPPGWDDWRVITDHGSGYYDYDLNENGTIIHYGHADQDYSTDVLSSKAQQFIRDSAGNPFLLMFAPASPHIPAIPARRHVGAFAGLPRWQPPNFNEQDVRDKPAWLQAVPLLSVALTHDIEDTIEAQLEANLAVDEAVGAIMDTLRAQGIDQETMVIFLGGDNGYNWGEHRLTEKNCPYEECLRTALIVNYPPLTKGTLDDHLVLNVDLPSTIADLAGVSVPITPSNGLSLIPILDGSVTAWRDAVLEEHWEGGGGPRADSPTWAAVRTRQWKYIEYADRQQGTELYDIIGDPSELNNVTNESANADLKADLASQLRTMRAE